MASCCIVLFDEKTGKTWLYFDKNTSNLQKNTSFLKNTGANHRMTELNKNIHFVLFSVLIEFMRGYLRTDYPHADLKGQHNRC